MAGNDAAGRYAVADGASEGCFSRLWASMLVSEFVVADVSPEQWTTRLPSIQAQWNADVGRRTLRPSARRNLDRGAFATMLAVVFEPVEITRRWRAVAVGDTCLMHSRGSELLRTFPLQCAADFGNQPNLVGSRMSVEAARERQLVWSEGRGEPGDRVWAMTDALARWCLAECERGGDPWAELEAIIASTPWESAFVAWIEQLRDARQLSNDDVTLVAIQL